MIESATIGVRAGERLRLIALLDGVIVGSVRQAAHGTLRFVYTREWRDNPNAYPLSLSMPLSAAEHGDGPTSAFLWGLLPDNTTTLAHYGRLFGVSSSNAVALLAHIGADCAGAVQFAPPEGVADLLDASNAPLDVEWLSSSDIASELRTVRAQGIPGNDRRTVGQFSLAGAQPKIALFEENGRWGRPHGRTATNRILKPPSTEYPGFAENEHLCLEITGRLGLGAVQSRVMRFEDETAIVVDRFDRFRAGNAYRRIHQEDLCQALAVMPTQKYQSDGGPGPRDVVSLLRDASAKPNEDIDRFIAMLALSWALAATDGHAKNYALLHAPGVARLAPFYDVTSYLPYADAALYRVKLAMKIGTKYLVRQIGRSSWETLAKSCGVPVANVFDKLEAVLTTLPQVARDAASHAESEGLDPEFVNKLAERATAWSSKCLAALASGPPG